MKTNNLLHFLGTISIFGLMPAILAQPASAATYSWIGSGAQTWSTSSINWTAGGNQFLWDAADGTANVAAFYQGGDAPTLSGSNVYVNGIDFLNTAAISSGTINLVSASGSPNAVPTITVNASGGTIGSVLAGSAGLIVGGNNSSTLTLNGANTFTGGLTINSGIVFVGNASALGNSSGILTLSGGSINFDGKAVANPIYVVSGSTTNLYYTAGNSGGLSGAITGSGTILNKEPGGLANFFITGDISGFAGTIDLETGDNPTVGASSPAGAMNGSHAHYIVNGTNGLNFGANGTYQMGDLSGGGSAQYGSRGRISI